MSYKDLSVKNRYILLFVLLFCLTILGSVLLKSWNQTPDSHFFHAIQLMNKNQPDKALNHFLLSKQSEDFETRKISNLYLARLYHHGSDKIPVNMKKAVFYYEQAAAAKSEEALYTLALLYDAGDKVPENREKAKDYMSQAALGLPEAQYALAVWIERGYFGTPDTKRAVALYESAANAGIQNAIKSLISIYHGGFGGFPSNIRKEHYWRAKLNDNLS